jgi:hypothetical protein
MNPGTWSGPSAAHRLPAATLLALAVAIVLAGVLLVAVLAAAGPSMGGAPAPDLLLAPFRWATLAERGLA